MKKVLLLILGVVAAIVMVMNLGPMITLAVCVGLLYIVFRQFMKSRSVLAKIGWIIAGVILLAITAGHLFALAGILAAYFLFLIIRKWKDDGGSEHLKKNDPFTSFERQWSEMNK